MKPCRWSVRLWQIIACAVALLAGLTPGSAAPSAALVGTGAGSPDHDAPASVRADPSPSLHETFSIDESYVDGSTLKTGSAGLGSLSEQHFKVSSDLRIPVGDQWSVILRDGYQRFDFGGYQAGAPLPHSLESVSLGFGLGYKIDSQWQVFGIAAPELQEINDWGSSSYLRLTGILGANYRWNEDLTVGLGLALNPGGLRDFPVLPVALARWHFASDWFLNVGAPRTSVEYRVTQEFRLSLGAGVEGGEFRTTSAFGSNHGNTGLDHQKFEYQEIRVGLGAEYQFHPLIALTGELGSAVYRDFNFHDSDYRPHADPAPYCQVGVRVRF